MTRLNISELNRKFKSSTPEEVLEFVLSEFGREKLVLASSMSIEDQVLTHMLLKIEKKPRIFFLDTGRHFQKTYDLLDETMKIYGVKYEVYAPKTQALQDIVSQRGPNFFYDSIEERKACCGIRKVEPLNRVLATADVWICGLRRDQSTTRHEISLFEQDEPHGIYKVNPIACWSEQDVWDYIKKNNIPYNKLHDQGYPSIGCEPCTRVVKPGEDIRSGRWWWENPDKKECGLHIKSEVK